MYSAQPDCTEENRFSKYQVYDEGMYEGWWVNGRPHGQGSFALFGNEYTGEWREGMKSGKGTFTYATGEVYEGDWESDVPCACYCSPYIFCVIIIAVIIGGVVLF